MSQRAKRPNRSEDGSLPVKRRKRTAAEEEEAASLAAWQPRSADLKSIYNRTTTEAPAELFRKDLISAMKLPDSEPLASNEYWVIVDQWKQEWERGVQVPVNPDSLPEPSVVITAHPLPIKSQHEFKLPKNKYIRITKDANFKVEEHALSNAPAQAEAACSYDLDECDVAWLNILNAERTACAQPPINEDQLERVIEQFELTCWEKIQTILRNEEGLGIEYDENVICDVCRSPDSEEGNEMVFCDVCNICVHQACYGITRIPEGQWLCCTCQLGQRPKCVLCPNKGGAMKCTRSGQKWAHVSCALWIPEVSIGCVEKMEPITKISSIPASRWALICVLCRERVGACIQCSVKTCKTAYHVTCAFKHGLEMRAIIEDENADDGVKLRSYCEKHSKSSKKEKSVCSGSEEDDSRRKRRKDMTSEEKNQARAARLHEIEAEFFKHVSIKDVSIHMDVDNDALHYIYNYWKLKRKGGGNKPLLPPKSEDVDMLSHKREQADLEKMKMFVQLRQDLERVRNLCYMVSRREKLSRSFFRLREQTFHKQTAVLERGLNLPSVVIQSVIEANHGPSIYDRLYSHKHAPDHTADFDTILARIAGLKSPTDSGDEKKSELNGILKNPYKRMYFNGTSKRRSLYGSSSAASSEDEKPKIAKDNLITSSEDEKPSSSVKKKSISTPRRSNNSDNKTPERRRKYSVKVESSSEDDTKSRTNIKDWGESRSRLKQVERELGYSGSDSDELMPIHAMKKTSAEMKMSSIYSDTDSSDVSMKNDGNKSSGSVKDPHSRLRTKAAVKEFSHKPSANKTSPENKKKPKPDSKKDNQKKQDYVQSDLIVPQRQAAKKATENLKSTTTNRIVKEPAEEQPLLKIDDKPPKTPKPVIPKSKKETKQEPSKKEVPKQDVFDIDKDIDGQEILAYVPQRQAAKKAAEHIKSGLVKPITAQTPTEQSPEQEKNKKEMDTLKTSTTSKPTAARISEMKRKSSSNSSSSSTSSSSSSSSSCSSSDSEEAPSPQPQREKKPEQSATPRSESHFSGRESAKRTNAKDWPFLDKGTKPKASSSSSDSSDSSRSPSPVKKEDKPKSTAQTTGKSSEKKQSEEQQQSLAEREESARPRVKGRPAKNSRTNTKSGSGSERIGDADVRLGNMSECSNVERERTAKNRKGKSTELEASVENKETTKSGGSKIQSQIVGKADKKVTATNNVTRPIERHDIVSNIEKEILERKAGKQNANAATARTKSTFDRLFGPTEKKVDKEISKSPSKTKPTKVDKQSKSTVKENKEPVLEKLPSPKKSPLKTKTIDEIFAQKSLSKENKLAFKESLLSPRISQKEVVPKSPEIETHPIDNVEARIISQKLAIPETTQNRSIFSPPPIKDVLLDFDNFEDGFGMSKDDEVLKGPLTFNFANSSLFKEDSKEDSARETLNLVEKLRMEMSKKSGGDFDDGASVSSRNENLEFTEQVVPQNVNENKIEEIVAPPMVNLDMHIEIAEVDKTYETKGPEMRYEADVPLEQDRNIPILHHALPDHGVTSQGDERWVPPSDTFKNYDPRFLQYSSAQSHQSVDETLVKDQSPSQQQRISQTQQQHMIDPDCMPSPSPYHDMHPQAKWAESEIMPNRRSSSSSAASSSSSCSRRNEDEELKMRQDVLLVNHPTLDNLGFLPPQGLPFASNNFDPFAAFTEASHIAGPVSLFHPPLNTQLPFPSAGASSMFPPAFGAPFPTPHSVVSQLPKPVDDSLPYSSTCTAAFTSSQHNMALTAAMVNLPPPKELEPPVMEQETREEPTPQPIVQSSPQPIVQSSPQPIVQSSPSLSVKSTTSSFGKKSPSKPTRTSARVTSQLGKSPSKSPAKSPRQEPGKGRGRAEARKTNPKTGRQGQTRGRGRGRGRGGRNHSIDYDLNAGGNTINKLVGTVYDLDFDDDISNDNMTDLKSMRERRKSTDIHDQRKDPIKSPSPKFTSPKNSRTYQADLRELRPPTPVTDTRTKTIEEVSTKSDQIYPQPVLPGPVDMRTYNTDLQTYNEANLLNAFATGAPPETQVHEEIDEDFEKELHSALTTKKPEEPPNIKVSLSDSRNQLLVKIKGPIANYSSTQHRTVDPIIVSSSISNNVISNNTISTASGTSNLRRMRKKELLRQYWTQENMDDPSCASGFNATPAVPPVNRSIITIPKAVASMTSIPTKDDYRDYRTGSDDFLETKPHRKEPKTRPGTRELRQLEVSLDEDGLGERRRSAGGTNDSSTNKRRGRPPRLQATTPKIKIKIGGNSIVESKVDDKKDRIRPPKKRLSKITLFPSVEDLKRENMKFRKKVMADFDKVKEKRKKKDKGDKKKRKKTKGEMRIISNESSQKLIIRLGKKDEGKANGEGVEDRLAGGSEMNNATEMKMKITPIKLTLSRCQEGSYVMKSEPDTKTKAEESKQPGQPPPPAEPPPRPPPNCSKTPSPKDVNVRTSTTTNEGVAPPPLPLNKDCEVR